MKPNWGSASSNAMLSYAMLPYVRYLSLLTSSSVVVLGYPGLKSSSIPPSFAMSSQFSWNLGMKSLGLYRAFPSSSYNLISSHPIFFSPNLILSHPYAHSLPLQISVEIPPKVPRRIIEPQLLINPIKFLHVLLFQREVPGQITPDPLGRLTLRQHAVPLRDAPRQRHLRAILAVFFADVHNRGVVD